MVMGNEHAINVLGFELQSGQAFGELGAAEPLVDQHLRVGCFEQRRVASTARSQMRDGHGHVNIATPAREGLESTDETAPHGAFFSKKTAVWNGSLYEQCSIMLISNLSRVKRERG